MSDFLQFCSERGLIVKSLVYGKWARVPTVDHPHKRNGAYWFEGTFGHCQNWAIMEGVESWQDKKQRTQFEQQELNKRMEASRQVHAQERINNQRKAAQKAKWILSQCELSKHAYLDSKGWKEMRGNVWKKDDERNPLLIVPMYFRNEICGAQCIDIDGSKKFIFGQRTNDAYFKIGKTGRVFLCEGYASALSLQAITAALKLPCTIYATFSANNLVRVAKSHPDGFVVADNDVSLTGQKAAEATGLPWWMPEVAKMDINDLHKEVGLFKASQIFRKGIM